MTEHGAIRKPMNVAGFSFDDNQQETLAVEFANLARSLFQEKTVRGVLDRVVEVAHDVIPGADLVSVTLVDSSGNYLTPSCTAELATKIDQIQYVSKEGPCLQAARDSGLAMSADLALGEEWPTFGPAAASAGVRSVLSVGLFPDGQPPRLGSLNCYSQQAHGLDHADRDIALLLAAHVSTALAGTQALSESELRAAHLGRALESRDVIGQAKGILMERRGINAQQAFDLLRAASQHLNIKLAELARTLTQNRGAL